MQNVYIGLLISIIVIVSVPVPLTAGTDAMRDADVTHETDGRTDNVMAAIENTRSSYDVTVTKQGSGGGMVYGEGIECGYDCTESYPEGSSVTLNAYPNALSLFTQWLLNGVPTQDNTFVVTGNMTITAVFDVPPPSCVPSNGGVEQCDDGIDNDCDGKIDEGCGLCRTDFANHHCCLDDVCTPMSPCEAGAAAIFLGCSNVACNPMVRCETRPQGGPCTCEIANDGRDNDCDGYADEPADEGCMTIGGFLLWTK